MADHDGRSGRHDGRPAEGLVLLGFDTQFLFCFFEALVQVLLAEADQLVALVDIEVVGAFDAGPFNDFALLDANLGEGAFDIFRAGNCI